MRRLLPRFVILIPPLLMVLVGLLMISRVSGNSLEGFNHLRVSVPDDGLLRAPSCVHTFSQVELTNTHKSESIVVKSMQVQDMDAKPRERIPGTPPPFELHEVHVSEFNQRELSLKPGQVASVPISILPVFTSFDYEHEQEKSDAYISHPDAADPTSHPPRLSKAAEADLADLIGRDEEQRRNEKETGEEKFSKWLFVNTDRGSMGMPLRGSIVPQNPYGLPATVVFRDSAVSYSTRSTGWDDGSGGNVDWRGRDPNLYDIYMNNPSPTDELRILDVFSSRSSVFDIEYLQRLGGHSGNASGDSGTDNPTRWSLHPYDDGPPVIPAGAKRSYVATARMLDSTFFMQEGPEYLHIITDVDHLVIAVELINDRSISKGVFGASTPRGESDLLQKTQTIVAATVSSDGDTEATGRRDLDARGTSSEQLVKDATDDEVSDGRTSDGKEDSSPNQNLNQGAATTDAGTLTVSPSRADFGIITRPLSQKVRVGINITNNSPVLLKLMRVTVGMDVPSNGQQKEMNEIIESFGLDIDVEIGSFVGGSPLSENAMNPFGGPEWKEEDDVFIPPNGGVAQDAVVLTCSSHLPEHPNETANMPRKFSGTVVIRAGDADKSFNDWKKSLRMDPSSAQHLVVEVPFVATVFYGHIAFDMDQLRFPSFRAWDESPNQKEESQSSPKNNDESESIDRMLYFTNHFPTTLKLLAIRIDKTNDFCQRTFKIVGFEGFDPKTKSSKMSVAQSGSRWGGITLRYSFGDGEEDLGFAPRECLMILQTDKAGEQAVPLSVFSGMMLLEADTLWSGPVNKFCEQSEGGKGENRTICAERWYRNSPEGKALKTILQKQKRSALWRKARNNDLEESFELLKSYLLSLTNQIAPRMMEPMVLSLGAIGAGEVESYPLYLTNLNPVPVTVTATTSAVEGMELVMGRTQSAVIDYIQSPKNDGKDGLRRFLATSPLTQNFFGMLGYKADISLSPRAISDELKRLYRNHSMMQTFREPMEIGGPLESVPVDPNENNIRTKNGNAKDDEMTMWMHPPGFAHLEGQGLNNRTDNWLTQWMGNSAANQGPHQGMLLSADGDFLYELSPRTQSRQKQQGGWTIPPGGVARISLAVRAPPKTALKDDVTSFLGTGLALETNYGQTMPIITSYDALLGQLKLSSLNGTTFKEGKEATKGAKKVHIHEEGGGILSGKDDHTTKIDVPVTIRELPTGKVSPHSQEPPKIWALNHDPEPLVLFLESTFSQDMILRHVESCNKWFTVLLSTDVTSRLDLGNEYLDSKNDTAASLQCSNHGREETRPQSSCSAEIPRFPGERNFQSSNDRASPIVIKANSGEAAASSSKKVPIGTLHSVVACSRCSHNEGQSFYGCALEWLEKRDLIQPPGCGLSEEDVLVKISSEGSRSSNTNPGERGARGASAGRLETKKEIVKSRAIAALRDVVSYLTSRYELKVGADVYAIENNIAPSSSFPTRNTSHYVAHDDRDGAVPRQFTSSAFPGNDGPLPQHLSHTTIQKFHAANKAWKEVSDLGMNVVTGSVRAKTDYYVSAGMLNNNDDGVAESKQQSSFTVSMPSLLLQSTLTVPKLCTGSHSNLASKGDVSVLAFEKTHVAQVSQLHIPVRNPSGVPIRIRLAASTTGNDNDPYAGQEFFVQSKPGDTNPWWTGGNYWMSDFHGNLLQANHNVTIKSGGGAYVSLVNPSLHSISAFVLGCGRRCGLRNEGSNNMEKMVSPIGAASSDGTTLTGHSYESNGAPTPPGRGVTAESLGTQTPPAFALSLQSMSEIVIPPHGTGRLGPIHFRPPKRGAFEGTLFLENSLTGLEEVNVKGEGGWERIVFLDNVDEVDYEAGDLELRYGRSTLVFPGSAASSSGNSVMKSVVVANAGDFAVDIESVHLTTGEIVHFTNRRPHPRLSQKGGAAMRDPTKGSTPSSGTRCSERGFHLVGCVDEEPNSWGDNLFPFPGIWKQLIRLAPSIQKFSWPTGQQQTKHAEDFDLNEGFVLLPNKTKTIYIEHKPDCTFSTMYVSLNLVFRGRSNLRGQRRGSSRNNNVWDKSFQHRKTELLLGYDMSSEEVKNCIPYSSSSHSLTGPKGMAPTILSFFSRWLKARQEVVRNDYPGAGGAGIPLALLFLFLAYFLVEVFSSMGRRKESSTNFRGILSFVDPNNSSARPVDSTSASSKPSKSDPGSNGALSSNTSNNWNSAFRCLARADPTSSDLIMLGKEQTRQVLLSKYKKIGVLPTQCLLPNGGFVRERLGTSGGGGGTSSHPTGGSSNLRAGGATMSKRGSMGSQHQVLMLSDAIFHQYGIVKDSSFSEKETVLGASVLPCALGWRAAASRGVISPLVRNDGGDLEKRCKFKRVQELLSRRGKTKDARSEQPEDKRESQDDNSSPLPLPPPPPRATTGSTSVSSISPLTRSQLIEATGKRLESAGSKIVDGAKTRKNGDDVRHPDIGSSLLQNETLRPNSAAQFTPVGVVKQKHHSILSEVSSMSPPRAPVQESKDTTTVKASRTVSAQSDVSLSKKSSAQKGKSASSPLGIRDEKRGKGESTGEKSEMDTVSSAGGVRPSSAGGKKGKKKNDKQKQESAARGVDTGSAVQPAKDKTLGRLDKKSGEKVSGNGAKTKSRLPLSGRASDGTATASRDKVAKAKATPDSSESGRKGAKQQQQATKKRSGASANSGTGTEATSGKTRKQNRQRGKQENASSSAGKQNSMSPQSSTSSVIVAVSPPQSPVATVGSPRQGKTSREVSAPPLSPTQLSLSPRNLANQSSQKVTHVSPSMQSKENSPGQQKRAEVSPKIRPPPGLAPPPGFTANHAAGSSKAIPAQCQGAPPPPNLPPLLGATHTFATENDNAVDASSSAAHGYLSSAAAAMPSPPAPAHPQGSDIFSSLGSTEQQLDGGLLASLLGDKTQVKSDAGDSTGAKGDNIISGTELRMASPPIGSTDGTVPEVKPLLGLGGGFNVSNFLDGILDDSNNADEGDELHESTVESFAVSDDPVVPALDNPYRAAAHGVPLDPWQRAAGTRATSYGIAVGGLSVPGGDGGSVLASTENSGNVVGLIGMPAAATILDSIQAESQAGSSSLVSDEEGEEMGSSESFYANLLGED